MSAFGGKADVIQGVAECPLIAISGHSKDTCPNLHPTAVCGRNCLATPLLLLSLATCGSKLENLGLYGVSRLWAGWIG